MNRKRVLLVLTVSVVTAMCLGYLSIIASLLTGNLPLFEMGNRVYWVSFGIAFLMAIPCAIYNRDFHEL